VEAFCPRPFDVSASRPAEHARVDFTAIGGKRRVEPRVNDSDHPSTSSYDRI
jgi:hypothetical protein